MRSAFVVTLLLGSLLSIHADAEYEAEKQKLRQKAAGLMTECKDKVGASAEDVQALTNKQLPTSEKGFCMIECIFTNGGIMKDGKLDVQNTLKVLEPALSKNPDVKKKTTAALETCEKEVGAGGANGCETAKLLAECFKKEAKK